MKERPIIFSAPMVRAILAGNKTQTRRVVNVKRGHRMVTDEGLWQCEDDRCPYGERGNRLWVRETWWKGSEDEDEAPSKDRGSPTEYKADSGAAAPGGWDWMRRSDRPPWARWRSPLHMPRWASRITLEIVDVRVQRVQDITEGDARAEGVDPMLVLPGDVLSHVVAFGMLWDSINHKRASWDSNPWVWALTFKVLP